MSIKIEWIKCPHGIEKRVGCSKCREEQQSFKSLLIHKRAEPQSKIPIKRGCHAIGGCFCNGSCQEIIGYRDPLFEGESY